MSSDDFSSKTSVHSLLHSGVSGFRSTTRYEYGSFVTFSNFCKKSWARPGYILSSEHRDGLSIYRILEQHQVVTISPLCGIVPKVHVLVKSDYRQISVMTSLGKETVDSRVLGRDRHQVVQDYHVSYSVIEVVIAVQVHRDASDEFHLRNHRPTYLIVEGLPSLVQPDDSLRRCRHLGATVL